MGWEQIKDYMNSFIAILILGVPLIIEAIKAKRSKVLIFIYVVCCIGLVFLGYDKIKRDNRKEIVNTKKDSALNQQIIILQKSISNDSTERREVYKKLESKFDIIIDSTKNPVKVSTYNTNFEKARDVYIGDK